MSKAWSGGSTRGWRKIRAAILLRDGYRCRMGDPEHPIGRDEQRSPDCTGGTRYHEESGRPLLHVHHTKGRAVTGDDPRFMVTACERCNLSAGNPVARQPAPRPMTKW